MNDNERYLKFSTLYEKSLRLIDEQYDDYKIVHGKTTTLISLSAFIFPLILSTSNFATFNLSLTLLLIIPILTYLISLVLFSIILHPNKLKHGIKFSKIEESFNEDLIDVLKKEIIALKKAFELNKSIVEKQNARLKLSIILILFSIGFICIIVFIGHAVKPEHETQNINIENINNYKVNKMKTEDYFPKNENDKNDRDTDVTEESSSQEAIPDVSASDLESFTKSDDEKNERK